MATPRPLLDPNRSKMDRVVDFIVGDGPSNRYALICSECHCHNGMALAEEFLYLKFRCAYCNFLNPSKKERTLSESTTPQLPAVNKKIDMHQYGEASDPLNTTPSSQSESKINEADSAKEIPSDLKAE
eukprot:Sdes_comp20970_c0_seq10m19036